MTTNDTRRRRDILEQVAIALGGTPGDGVGIAFHAPASTTITAIVWRSSDQARALEWTSGVRLADTGTPAAVLITYGATSSLSTEAHSTRQMLGDYNIVISDELVSVGNTFWPRDDGFNDAGGTFVTGGIHPENPPPPTALAPQPHHVAHAAACTAYINDLDAQGERPEPSDYLDVLDNAVRHRGDAATDAQLMHYLRAPSRRARVLEAITELPELSDGGFWRHMVQNAPAYLRGRVALVAAFAGWRNGDLDLATDAMAVAWRTEGSRDHALTTALGAVMAEAVRHLPGHLNSLLDQDAGTETKKATLTAGVTDVATTAEGSAQEALEEMLGYLSADAPSSDARIEAWCRRAVAARWWRVTADVLNRMPQATPGERAAAVVELVRHCTTEPAPQRSSPAEHLAVRATQAGKASYTELALHMVRDQLLHEI